MQAMDRFFLVPGIRPKTALYSASPDSLTCDYHARFDISQEDLKTMLSNGWTTVASPLNSEHDSAWIQSMIGPAIGWDYSPATSADRPMAYRSKISVSGGVQGMLRRTPSGTIVFIDRWLDTADVPGEVGSIMHAGGCDSAFPSQGRIELRTTGSATSRPSPGEAHG